MFNAEKLLGKIVGEVVGKKSGSWGSRKKTMLGGLGSGGGLMTIIGLGVGAYEILKQQQQQKSQSGGAIQPPFPPGSGMSGSSTPPPPPPGRQTTSPPPPPPGGAPIMQRSACAPPSGGPGDNELAIRLIQVMVAAAHADGTVDAQEERAVLDRLRGAELTQEEKMFLLNELHQPKTLAELTVGISDPSVAKTMYMLAVAAIEIDTEAERAWLNQLAGQLGISREIQSFIEEQR